MNKIYEPNNNRIKRFVVVGGGTAGWISASILSKTLAKTESEIILVESPNTPSVGVGEATVPSMVDLLGYLRIPFVDFVKKTNATFKLGIKFVDWYCKGEHFWNPFGLVGNSIEGKPFYHHWLKYRREGGKHSYFNFSPAVIIAKDHKFVIPDPKKPNNLSNASYAFHFDALLVAKYLEQYCLNNGIKLIKKHITDVVKNSNGDIAAVIVDSEEQIEGDFFIDCSGQQALLIEKSLNVGLQNWQHYLPANKAVVVQSEKLIDIPPYTLSNAHEHGWRWQIPLQNRTGNGYVYCSDYCSDQQAKNLLANQIEGEVLTDYRVIEFTTGKREKIWYKNCLAVGLSSGFLEPLESTSIHLIIKAMLNFVQILPDKNTHEATINEFNRLIDIEYESVRDFIVMHYCTSARDDSEFWRMWKNKPIPESLQTKLALFSEYGRLYHNELDFFSADSWYSVLEGMHVQPKQLDPRVALTEYIKLSEAFNKAVNGLKESTAPLLSHQNFIDMVMKR